MTTTTDPTTELRAQYRAAKKIFRATLPSGIEETRTSHTMNYTHAVAELIPADEERSAFWRVRHWCGSLDLAMKAERRASPQVSKHGELRIVEVRT